MYLFEDVEESFSIHVKVPFQTKAGSNFGSFFKQRYRLRAKNYVYILCINRNGMAFCRFVENTDTFFGCVFYFISKKYHYFSKNGALNCVKIQYLHLNMYYISPLNFRLVPPTRYPKIGIDGAGGRKCVKLTNILFWFSYLILSIKMVNFCSCPLNPHNPMTF